MIGGYFLILAPGNIYNSLVSEDLSLFRTSIIRFAIVATAVLFTKLVRGLLRESCANQLRFRLTKRIHSLYFGAGNSERSFSPPPYYKVVHEGCIDNPDQRIVTDTRDFSSTLLDVIVGGGIQGADSGGVIEAVASILFYTVQTFIRLGWFGIAAAYLWSTFVSLLTVFVINRTSPIVFTQERLEADLRYAHAQLRRHAEEVAFLRGGPFERRNLNNRLSQAVQNQWAVIWRHLWLNGLQYGFAYYISLVMYLSLAFAVHAHLVQKGLGFPSDGTGGEKAQWVSQTGGVFIQLLFSFTMFIQLGTSISSLVPNIERLTGFINSITPKSDSLNHRDHVISIATDNRDSEPLISSTPSNSSSNFTSENDIVLDRVRTKYSSARLLNGVSLSMREGDNVLLCGPTGCGKTSTLRAMRGLWKATEGRIKMPENELDVMFAPQKAYVPIGEHSLKDIVTYPHVIFSGERSDMEKIRHALTSVGWPGGKDGRIDISARDNWVARLSPGEVQMIAAARVLFFAPRFAILDEPTSALDHQSEAKVLEALRDSNISTLIVGHGEQMKDLQRHVVHMDGSDTAITSISETQS